MNLGDRMKMYEDQESARFLLPGLPICIRLDGRAFHSFTKGLTRPFDKGFRDLMSEVTRALVHETNACMGYTQSDEISLILLPKTLDTQYFSGRVQKITSTLAAICSVKFNQLLPTYLPSKVGKAPATFDCRVWTVPNFQEVVNYLIWREQDATRNSISAAAQSMFSPKQLHKLSSPILLEKMLVERGVDWNSYPTEYKRGTYLRRKVVRTPFDASELASLPAKHAAHTNPDLIIERAVISRLEIPALWRISNAEDVLAHGADPIAL